MKSIESWWPCAHGIDIQGKTVIDVGCNNGALSQRYLDQGASEVIGFDIDTEAIQRARERHPDARLRFINSTV